MNELGRIDQLIIPFLGTDFTINIKAVLMTWLVFAILIIFGYLAARKKSVKPGSLQVMGEMIVKQMYTLVADAMEDEENTKRFWPLICAIFMFLLLSNWIGMVPFLEEPTKDLNIPLSLGILGFVIAHYMGIKTKGFVNYCKEYAEPMFFMAPLNIIGELAKVVSISFRLFGNIMGGSIIILVVSYLIYSVILPPFLNLFFGLFVGAIQAFVFTMLTLVYISVQVK